MPNLIKDEDLQFRHAVLDGVTQVRHETLERVKAEATDDRVAIHDPGNIEKQMGRTMSTAQLETLIHSLVSPDRIKFLTHPQNPAKRCAYLRDAKGDHAYYFAFENTQVMPEHSILEVVEERVLHPDMVGAKAIVDRGVLERDGPDAAAGFVTIKRPGRELVRGWRTVLLRLIMDRIITFDAIERFVGGDQRVTWASKAKGLDVVAPY